MEERFFLQEGTEEETVILLAKDKTPQTTPQPICFANAKNLEELKYIIEQWDKHEWTGQYVTARPAYLYSSSNALKLYESISESLQTKSLGDLIKISLGIVTGNNAFFVINESTKKQYKINSCYLRGILPRIRQAKGLNFSKNDHNSVIKSNLPCHLIHTKKVRKDSPLIQYLNLLSETDISNNKTFCKRTPWFAPDDGLNPNAFLSVMNHHGPKMVLNEANVTCTNTIYRAYFINKNLSTFDKKLIAISLLTTFSQLSAEFTGRRYGSGVLKHEPSEMRKIKLLLPSNIDQTLIDEYFSKIDQALRNDNHNSATLLADELILTEFSNDEKLTLQKELTSIRLRRQRSKYLSGAQTF